MPETITFRNVGNVVMALIMLVVSMAALVVRVLAAPPSDARTMLARNSVLFATTGLAICLSVCAYLPCLRLRPDELVVENLLTRTRIPWRLVDEIVHDSELRADAPTAPNRAAKPDGLTVRTRRGDLYPANAFRRPGPSRSSSPLFVRVRAEVERRANAAQADGWRQARVTVERPRTRLILVVASPVMLAAGVVAAILTTI